MFFFCFVLFFDGIKVLTSRTSAVSPAAVTPSAQA